MKKIRLQLFLSCGRGSVLIIVAVAFTMLVTAIGGAVDMSRYLIARTQAQAALDNALLSATAVKESQDVSSGVNTLFKANFPESIARRSGVIVTISDDGKIITGEAVIQVNAVFGSFIGFDSYQTRLLSETTAAGGGGIDTAIVLSLDNSPSMCATSSYGASMRSYRGCRKLAALRTAASNFINQVLEGNPSNVAVGLVPFNHNVKMHKSLGKHPQLGASVYIDGGATKQMVQILELTNNKAALLSRIGNMSVPKVYGTWGFTRTNVGTAAAGLMLMPYPEDTRYFKHNAGLPTPIDPAKSDKVLVLMTDGENVTYYENPANPDYLPHINNEDNAHQAQLCRDLKEKYGIIIYTIVYDLPNGAAKDVFRNCATNEQFFFDARSDGDLTFAYDKIAENISHVRLRR